MSITISGNGYRKGNKKDESQSFIEFQPPILKVSYTDTMAM